MGSLNTENLANSLWATCVFSLFLDSGLGWRWVYSGASATGPWVSLGEAAETCRETFKFECTSRRPKLLRKRRRQNSPVHAVGGGDTETMAGLLQMGAIASVKVVFWYGICNNKKSVDK